MRAEPEKFVADIPGHIPGRALLTPNFQAAATGSMKFGVRISGVNEHVRIDNKHLPSPFHHVVQGVAIGDIDKMTSAAKSGQGSKFRFRPAGAGLKQQPQRRFDQLGHRLTLPSRFPPETAHDGIVDVQRRLHMENHIDYMAICQIFPPSSAPLPLVIRSGEIQPMSSRPFNAGERTAGPLPSSLLPPEVRAKMDEWGIR